MNEDDYMKFMRELRIANYARNTIKTYSAKIKKFLEYAYSTDLDPKERIITFLDMQKTPQTSRHCYNAINLFYKLIVKKECPYTLRTVTPRKRLPGILSREDIEKILSSVTNKKHRLIISMLYGSGLRVSEVINIKITDIDLSNLMLTIRNSKSNKDRLTPISKMIANDLNEIIGDRDKKQYLFETIMNKKYSVRTVQKIFENALNLSGVKKDATCHTLRHSFATHLIESGVDIRSIKKVLGHKSVKTTMIYLHYTDLKKENIKSPL